MPLWRLLPHDSDARQAIYGLRAISVVLILYIASIIGSCTEMKYALFGAEADATVVRTSIDRHRGRETAIVRYHFRDADNASHEGRFSLPASSWHGGNGDPVEIIYLPGDPDTSTRPEDRSPVWIVIFVVMTGVAGFWSFQAYRLAQRGILI